MLPVLVILGATSLSISQFVVDNAPLNVVAVIVPPAKSPDPSLTTALLAVFVVVNTFVSVKSTANVLSAVRSPPPLKPAPELIFLFCNVVILFVFCVIFVPALASSLSAAAN